MYVFLFKGKNLYKLKELYTSISTLAQNLVLTFLNNKFILKILNSIPCITTKMCKI
jgi:hypothetical protein